MSTLSSWNDGPTKKNIIDFVKRVSDPASIDFVPPSERVAVFDNDGTLWCEKPLPIQADFLFRRLAATAKEDPSLAEKQPWKAIVEKDYRWLSDVLTKHYRGDDHDLKIMAGGLLQAYQGNTIEEFNDRAKTFLKAGQNPVLKRPYLECAYEPMIELLLFLEKNGFTNYIASGGSRDFMRPVTENLYQVPPERVIGSTVALEYRDNGEFATIVHKPENDYLDDGPEKPLRIWSRIGRRPIFAAGNSNGDIPMLHFCEHPSRPSMCILIDHDDSAREFDYQAGAEKALDYAEKHHWTTVSMKKDWKEVFH